MQTAPDGAAVPNAAERIDAARRLLRTDRARGLAELNAIFRTGTVPGTPALDGRYAGDLVALDIAPGLTELTERLASAWMPWKGKTFQTARARGDNVFTRDSLLLGHLWWPGYRGFVDDEPETYRAFVFRTYLAPGLADPDRGVLKIDYNLPRNPGLTIRRVLDELVEVGDGLYLGKAHMHWWWGRWQVVAYFTLARKK